MKFQKKIIIIYSIFSILVASVIGVVYYIMSVNRYKEREYENIKTVSSVKLQQFENQIKSMREVSTYVLSDVEALNALWTFSELKEDSYEDVYFNEASSILRSKIGTYYLMEKFYRIIIFNQNGNVVANNNYERATIDQNVSYKNYPWVKKVSGHGGKDVLIGLHQDDWGAKQNPMVISNVKEIQGSGLGFIEVQVEENALKELLDNREENKAYIFYTKEGDIIYSNGTTSDLYCYEKLQNLQPGVVQESRISDNQKVLCLWQESKSENLKMLTIVNVNISEKAMREALPVSLVLLISTFLLSVGYIYFTSKQLTKPIHQLQRFMETTQLDNLEADIPEKLSNDEIELLYVSYKNVLDRLNESILKEKRMSLLQLQAQFDLLQAQVNPHFIYNVLNVISNRGVISDDEVICDICSDLAGMLRYATNTKDKYATIQDEINYLELYLNLLKCRYEHKLLYHIQIPDNMLKQLLPKIVLQQIVENAVTHGYESSMDTIKINVIGDEDEFAWYLKISDNGCGITKECKADIYKAIEDIQFKLTKDRSHVELQIGGMGLVNTYARLYLLYNDNLIFEIHSEKGRGTEVIIGVKYEHARTDK